MTYLLRNLLKRNKIFDKFTKKFRNSLYEILFESQLNSRQRIKNFTEFYDRIGNCFELIEFVVKYFEIQLNLLQKTLISTQKTCFALIWRLSVKLNSLQLTQKLWKIYGFNGFLNQKINIFEKRFNSLINYMIFEIKFKIQILKSNNNKRHKNISFLTKKSQKLFLVIH